MTRAALGAIVPKCFRKQAGKGANVSQNMESICLKQDNGHDLEFCGRLFSECSYSDKLDSSNPDDKRSQLTRQRLYLADNGDHVYQIIRSSGEGRIRNAYRLSVDGDFCNINNGSDQTMSIQLDQLVLAVRALCGPGIDAEEAGFATAMEDTLRVAGGSNPGA